MEHQVFYQCDVCGNLAMMIDRSGMTPQCCGKAMNKLEAGKTDAPHEKHIPMIRQEGHKVVVSLGELPHPMSELHYIEWVYLQTNRGGYLRYLYPGDLPVVRFRICDNERIVCCYAYCNIHGLWESCDESRQSTSKG